MKAVRRARSQRRSFYFNWTLHIPPALGSPGPTHEAMAELRLRTTPGLAADLRRAWGLWRGTLGPGCRRCSATVPSSSTPRSGSGTLDALLQHFVAAGRMS